VQQSACDVLHIGASAHRRIVAEPSRANREKCALDAQLRRSIIQLGEARAAWSNCRTVRAHAALLHVAKSPVIVATLRPMRGQA